MVRVRVLGAGPAGGAAALAALQEGAQVELFEKSPFPRHKVCGEFLSPESALILDRLGVWSAFAERAARMPRMLLYFGEREKRGGLPDPAYGLSRSALDQLLLTKAVACGAAYRREKGNIQGATVVATGRSASAPKGKRLFGFKAHFRGPVSDAVEMFFLSGRAYAGVSPVEDGFTNVCGLAEEHVLAACNFEIDEYLRRCRPLRERLEPLDRAWDWLIAGPLIFQHRLNSPAEPGLYRAGDALSFIDPFTGSGILSALLTGSEAGRAAARRQASDLHLRLCRRRLLPPFQATSFFRKALVDGWGQWIAPWLPSPVLFHLTRPKV